MNPEMDKERERYERAEALRVLPSTPDPELSAGRLEARRRHLLAEFEREAEPAAVGEESRRGWWRPRIAFAAVATTAVLGLGLGLGLYGSPAPLDAPPPASAGSVRLLERAALAAAARPQVPVSAGQYAYMKVTGHTTVLSENASGGMDRMWEAEDMEQWTSVDGSRPTLQRKDGQDTMLPSGPDRGSLHSPTYAYAAGLPTDPGALLKLIHEDAEENHGAGSGSTTGPDQAAFIAIGDLLRSAVVPPGTTAALYRAATRIPGVVVVPDAVDAAGRRGTAVARVHDGERAEWIFDRATARFLGTRTVLTEDSAWGRRGTVVASLAVTGSGISDTAGGTPVVRDR
ncbi:CU044_5270 family protein [Streptomyces sp. SR27]|uniref:CU044_5270 family protein n=1 Tax=Streptomyces sp. SR27 TaxID=3076630 RepID=UPI00295BBB6D|nr:CU044_5270 family protein [Streptomyces sp. SR27]MDV9191880.1 CU044_5270 family protein [Streptomyces sp. SR27]